MLKYLIVQLWRQELRLEQSVVGLIFILHVGGTEIWYHEVQEVFRNSDSQGQGVTYSS
jgi:hypothetical protein